MTSFSVAIIGAGPAGLSAALWAKNLGLSPVIIEKELIAGGMQNFNFLENDWVLGLPEMTGVEIGQTLYRHVQQKNIPLLFSRTIEAINKDSDDFIIEFESQEDIRCQAIIIATGTRYIGKEILQNVKGITADSSFVIEGPYAFLNMDDLRGQSVGIIGGGDNAFENALMLLERNCRVTMVTRSEPRAQQKFLDKVISHSSFTLHQNTRVVGCLHSSDDCLNWQLQLATGDLVTINRLHILAGYQPNSGELTSILYSGLGKRLSSDDQHFLIVDESLRTNISGVYAAGDICCRDFPSVVSALSAGAKVAKVLVTDLVST